MRPPLPAPTPTPWSSLLSPMTISFWRIYFGDCLPLRYLAKWILHPGFWPPPNAFQIPKSQLHFFINHPFQRAGKFLGFLLITARMVSYCCCQACNQLVSSLCGDRHISSSWVKHLPQRRLQTLHTLLPGLPLLLGGRSSTVRPDPSLLRKRLGRVSLVGEAVAWTLCPVAQLPCSFPGLSSICPLTFQDVTFHPKHHYEQWEVMHRQPIGTSLLCKGDHCWAIGAVELWGDSSELQTHLAGLSAWVNVHSVRISKGSCRSICSFLSWQES